MILKSEILNRIKTIIFNCSPFIWEVLILVRRYQNQEVNDRCKREAKSLARLNSSLGKNFIRTKPKRMPQSVLMCGFGRADEAIIEKVVATAFEETGLGPIIITQRSVYTKKVYTSLGLPDVIPFSLIVSDQHMRRATQALSNMHCEQDLHNFFYNDVACGKFAMSSVMRSLRVGTINFSDSEVYSALIRGLAESISAVHYALKLIDKYNAGALVVVDRGYSPFGELSSVCIANQIPVYEWHIGHRNDLIIMKCFTASNAEMHFHSLSNSTWEKYSQIAWGERHQTHSDRELVDSYTSGQWYGEVGTQVHVSSVEKKKLIKQLGLDESKKTAVVFAHIFWDGTFFWGQDLFKNYEEWYCEVLKAAKKNPNLNWIIKIHPANIVKDIRDKHFEKNLEIATLSRILGDKPDHIYVLESSSAVSTLSLFSIMDYCLTVRGTIGIEAAFRGIPVLTAGTGRYDGLGFTFDFNDKKEYIKQLLSLEKLPLLTDSQIDLARKHAYAMFVVRPTRLSSISFEFMNDKSATLCSRIKVKNLEELKGSDDVQNLSKWINSGKEDYCETRFDYLP